MKLIMQTFFKRFPLTFSTYLTLCIRKCTVFRQGSSVCKIKKLSLNLVDKTVKKVKISWEVSTTTLSITVRKKNHKYAEYSIT